MTKGENRVLDEDFPLVMKKTRGSVRSNPASFPWDLLVCLFVFWSTSRFYSSPCITFLIIASGHVRWKTAVIRIIGWMFILHRSIHQSAVLKMIRYAAVHLSSCACVPFFSCNQKIIIISLWPATQQDMQAVDGYERSSAQHHDYIHPSYNMYPSHAATQFPSTRAR